MFQFHIRHVLSLLISLSLSLVPPAFAGGDGGNSAPMSPGGSGAGLSSATTKKVVKTITSGAGRCGNVQKVYRFDCYRQVYRQAAKVLNGRPAYAGAQEALIAVEQALDRIVAQNADPQTRTIRKGFQTFKPIKPAAVPKATVQLERALDEAETVLLRAPERTGTHYTRIAEAVNSNKVLLRSRLYPDGIDVLRTAFA